MKADLLSLTILLVNAFIESFNGRLRDELLNETLFTSLAQARVALRCWRADYNDARPHSQLGWKTHRDKFRVVAQPRYNREFPVETGSHLTAPTTIQSFQTACFRP